MWKWILATTSVTTCSIGTSMIGYGFIVSMVGFWPSLIAIFLSWAYLLITALYFLEATLARPLGANIFTISRDYFGPVSAWIVSIIWLFILFGTPLAFFYLAPLLISDILANQDIIISSHLIALILLIVVGGILCGGLHFTLVVNAACAVLIGLMLYQSYRLGFERFDFKYFKIVKLEFMVLMFPVLITSLYYHMVIPTIASFLNNDFKKIRSCIVIASLAAALLFAVWCVAIASAADQFEAENLVKLQFEHLNYDELSKVPILGTWMPYLSLLLLITSVFAIGIAIIDFWGDLLGYPYHERKGFKRIKLASIALIPALLLTAIPIQYTFGAMVFLTDFANLFVTGILPILWVWSLRHSLNQRSAYTTPGGNTALALMTGIACFMFYLLGIQIIYQSSV